tara:strand:+ start:4773 stop:6440 length:1668 start_codon:yes stop_codon:yes gene_type:complete
MSDIYLLPFLINYSKYILLFIVFFLLGRSFFLITNKLFNIDNHSDKEIFGTDITLFYPLVGIGFLGNIIFITNFMLPVKSILNFLIILSFISINFLNKPRFDLFEKYKFYFYTIFLFIPLVLTSTNYSIQFHYDAGYYHLNNQLWLYENPIVFGLSNVFSPYGIGSIYEYISSFLWVDKSYISLHNVNLIFIWFFYSFIFYHLLIKKDSIHKFPSLFLLIFSLLDNFGLDGGRNGFFYIQGVGKQDLAVGVLFFIVSYLILSSIKHESFSLNEFSLISFLTLFSIQLKISSVLIFLLYLVYVFKLLKTKKLIVNSYFLYSFIYIVFGILWIAKNLIISSCIVFPLHLSCLSFLPWFNSDFIKTTQEVTTAFSNSYVLGDSFIGWINAMMGTEEKRTVIINFFSSLLIIYILKILFLNIKKSKKNLSIIYSSFVVINLIYLIFFGPEPRYVIGLLLLIVSMTGVNAFEYKVYKLNKISIYILIIISVILVPRINSYSYVNLSETPKINIEKINYTENQGDWVKPESGDQCWINKLCTMEKSKIKLVDNGLIKYYDQ